MLSHPLLTNPADITADPVFVELPSLEVAQDIDKVVKSMTRCVTMTALLFNIYIYCMSYCLLTYMYFFNAQATRPFITVAILF